VTLSQCYGNVIIVIFFNPWCFLFLNSYSTVAEDNSFYSLHTHTLEDGFLQQLGADFFTLFSNLMWDYMDPP
jgi:hypothetical protein